MPTGATRTPWIDHFRTLAIMLVVSTHSCVTYSHIGSWFVNSDKPPGHWASFFFLMWEAHLQSFFMGVLFFFAGYYAYGSRRKRGTLGFVRERLFRLGLPTLFFMLVIYPFIVVVINPWHQAHPHFWSEYLHFILDGEFLSRSGPMWFTFALLIFCVIWALAKVDAASPLAPSGVEGPHRSGETPLPPSGRSIWIFAIGLGLASFAVRLVQPMGTSILNFQLCFFPQYIAAFVVGILASRRGWLLPLAASPAARRAGWLALIGGPIVFTLVVTFGARHGLDPLTGGWRWPALGYAMWEQLTGVGISLGLMSLLSTHFKRETPFLRWLSNRSFAVYLLHTPILIALYLAFRPLPWAAWPLAILMTIVGLVLSYIAADLARRIPLLRSII